MTLVIMFHVCYMSQTFAIFPALKPEEVKRLPGGKIKKKVTRDIYTFEAQRSLY